jgi:hypothetical protein
MAIFMLKGYAAGIPEIKLSRYETAEEEKGKRLLWWFWQRQAAGNAAVYHWRQQRGLSVGQRP